MEFQTAFEVFIGLTLLIAGLLTLAFRNRQNSLIGVRIGYTYMSEEAWRKANTAGGLFFVGFSVFLIIMALTGASIQAFLLALIVGVLAGVGVSVAVAKRTYELEELSREAPEKPTGERIEANIKPYLLVQLAFLGLYLLLVVLSWNSLPEPMAVHFDASGNPNGFMSRAWGAVGVPVMVWAMFFALTLLGRDPGFFVRMRSFSPTGWRAWAEFNTLSNLGLIAMSFIVVLYNLGRVSVKWVNYSVWGFLLLVFLGIYRLAKAK
ncbi:DUF1648 domain-containing protein [Thermococcus sp.]|uniref:DUF1648 domain-containing protein n=1 Tax=Thermococcus sp. TaxID=35749 RepID=UPI0026156FD1|nr:DUF1648 domain-containing protein [Thermococcus sp.]